MKKLPVLISALCLGMAGVTGVATAGPNSPDPLATITPVGCSYVQIAPFGTSLLARWDWSGGGDQTKFGGDAVFTGEASIDDGVTWVDFEVEFEVESYEPGTLAEDYFRQLVYRCSVAQTEPAGSCNGAVLGVRDALLAAVAEQLGGEPEEIGPNIRASLVGVDVKAMNPGPGNGRQNYPLTDVCDVEVPPSE
jgi:hypothetical protein